MRKFVLILFLSLFHNYTDCFPSLAPKILTDKLPNPQSVITDVIENFLPGKSGNKVIFFETLENGSPDNIRLVEATIELNPENNNLGVVDCTIYGDQKTIEDMLQSPTAGSPKMINNKQMDKLLDECSLTQLKKIQAANETNAGDLFSWLVIFPGTKVRYF